MRHRPSPPAAPPDPDETPLVRLPALLTAGGGAAGGDTPFHDHPGDEVVLVDRGSCRIAAGDRDHDVTAPAAVMVPRGLLHDQRNRSGVRSWYCTFRRPGAGFGGGLRQVALDPDDPLLEWVPSLCRCHLAADGVRAAEAPLLLAILARLDALAGRRTAERALPRPLLAAVRHIDRHLVDDLDAAALAAAAGVGPGHLRTLFRRHLGHSPQALHRERRLELAAKLLSGSYLGVGEVAAACGWRDPEYFARLFARRHGLPPRAWRHRHGG